MSKKETPTPASPQAEVIETPPKTTIVMDDLVEGRVLVQQGETVYILMPTLEAGVFRLREAVARS